MKSRTTTKPWREAGNVDLWPLKAVFMRVGADAAGLLAAVVISQLGLPGGVALRPFIEEHAVTAAADHDGSGNGGDDRNDNGGGAGSTVGSAVPYALRVGGRPNVVLRVSGIVEDLKDVVWASMSQLGRALKPYFLQAVKRKVRASMFAMLESRLLAWLLSVKPKSLSAEQLTEVARLLLLEVRSIGAMLERDLGMREPGPRDTALTKMVTVLKLIGSGEPSIWEPLLGTDDLAIATALRLAVGAWEGAASKHPSGGEVRGGASEGAGEEEEEEQQEEEERRRETARRRPGHRGHPSLRRRPRWSPGCGVVVVLVVLGDGRGGGVVEATGKRQSCHPRRSPCWTRGRTRPPAEDIDEETETEKERERKREERKGWRR